MREFCYRCYRPLRFCLCDAITKVNNQTPVWILQHPGEERHPFGTVRFAKLGLERVTIQPSPDPAGREFPKPANLPEQTALLYPGPGARNLEDMAPESRPKSLLLIDGTWSTAGKIYRANPWLAELPHVALAPAQAGNYRIRRAPKLEHLSTIEALVMALDCLEESAQTAQALSKLVAAFNLMIDRQLESQASRPNVLRRHIRKAPKTAPTAALSQTSGRTIAVWVETTSFGRTRGQRPALTRCVAQCLASNERFESRLEILCTLPATNLGHMELPDQTRLPSATFDSEESFSRRWIDFTRQDDLLVLWNQNSIEAMLATSSVPRSRYLCLKGVVGNQYKTAPGGVDEALNAVGEDSPASAFEGRSGKRLAELIAVIRALLSEDT